MQASVLPALRATRDPKGEELLLRRCPDPELFAAASEVVAREATATLIRELAQVLPPIRRTLASRDEAAEDRLDWTRIANTVAVVSHRRVWLTLTELFARERGLPEGEHGPG
jgi:hypothetical protein